MRSPTVHIMLAAATMVACCCMIVVELASAQDFTQWAQTPPMGWNSWDTYGSSAVEPEMRFLPAPFLNDLVPAAEGVSDSNGNVSLSIEPAMLPNNAPTVGGLVRPGIYLVEVTHPQLRIPQQYNEDTELTNEISRATVAGTMLLDLSF